MKLEILVEAAQKGNKKAMEEIIVRLMPFIIKKSRGIYIKGYDTEDLIQIGCISLIKAIKSFDMGVGKGFLPYATIAIINNFNYEIRQKCRCNHEYSLNTKNPEGMEFMDILTWDMDLEKEVILKEDCNKLKLALEKLSSQDRALIKYVYFNHGKLKDFALMANASYDCIVKRKYRALKKLASLMIKPI